MTTMVQPKMMPRAPGTNGAVFPAPGTAGANRMVVTPEMAAAWLERRYEHQRPVNASSVRMLSDQIKRGMWQYDGSTIVFDTNGRLIDGQHRCLAIIQAGVGVDALVVWGVREEAYKVKDTGRSRTAADALNTTNGMYLAPAARMLLLLEKTGEPVRGGGQERGITNAEIVDFVNKTPELVDAMEFIVSDGDRKRLVSVAQGAVLFFLMARVNRKAAETFWNTTASGSDLSVGDPRLTLLRFLGNAPRRGGGRLARRAILANTIKAWNAWREGRKVGLLKTSADESFPVAV